MREERGQRTEDRGQRTEKRGERGEQVMWYVTLIDL